MKIVTQFNYRYLLIIASFPTLLFSCKKDYGDQVSVNSGHTKGNLPNAPFNWETSSVMMPSLLPNSPTSALYNPSLPWSSGNGYLSPNILSDYKSSDGWYLIYNTFQPINNYYITNSQSGGLYFALYNIYRGILRFYLWIPQGDILGGSSIQHGLSVASTGATTSLLNFDGIDPLVKNTAIIKANNQGINQLGGWYAMQYEIAYDPNFTSQNYPSLGINWNAYKISTAALSLSGTQVGTISGSIMQQSTGIDWNSALIHGIMIAAEIYGVGDISQSGSLVGNPNVPSLLQSAAAGGLAGNSTGILSAIIGGNSNNTQEVDLKMNTTLQVSGTITTPSPVLTNPQVFPGEAIANNPAYPPLFMNSSQQTLTVGGLQPSLGVFNLVKRPTVHVASTKRTPVPSNFTLDWPASFYYLNSFSIDPTATIINGPVFVVNPVIAATGATLRIVKTEILLENAYHNDEFYNIAPHLENIGDLTLSNVSAPYNTCDGIIWGSQSDGQGPVLVRYTVAVTSPTGIVSTIIKTFIADVVTP